MHLPVILRKRKRNRLFRLILPHPVIFISPLVTNEFPHAYQTYQNPLSFVGTPGVIFHFPFMFDEIHVSTLRPHIWAILLIYVPY